MKQTVFPSHKIVPACTLVSVLAILAITTASAAFSPFSDDFSGTALNTDNWNSNVTSTASGSISVSESNLLASAGVASGSQRATIISRRSDFNPFEQSLALSFSGLSVGGTPGTGANVFYAMIGNTSAAGDGTGNSYYPTKSTSDGAGYLAVLVTHLDSGWQVSLRRSSAIVETFDITGIPVSLEWTVDATGDTPSWSLTLGGDARFSDNSVTKTGTYSSVTATMFTTAGSYLALGALNLGNVDTGTSIGLGSVDVSVKAIPEPATTTALLGLGCLAIVLGCCRRRRR
ncbi:anchor protein [Opitutaceae bacterium TAV5]|nr:anchor protein [Opitutaceae bacterium TAV5]